MLLHRARTAILPAAALAAWGLTAWTATLHRAIIPASLAVVFTVWTLLDYYTRKFWRDTRKAQFNTALTALAEGVAAEMHERIDGDGQHAPGPRTGA
jgi:hypothetical protein